MVYALMIALLFSLVLQFYLNSSLNEKRALLLQRERGQAELMLAIYRKKMPEKAGEMSFDKGRVKAERRVGGWQYRVKLSKGGEFSFFKSK